MNVHAFILYREIEKWFSNYTFQILIDRKLNPEQKQTKKKKKKEKEIDDRSFANTKMMNEKVMEHIKGWLRSIAMMICGILHVSIVIKSQNQFHSTYISGQSKALSIIHFFIICFLLLTIWIELHSFFINWTHICNYDVMWRGSFFFSVILLLSIWVFHIRFMFIYLFTIILSSIVRTVGIRFLTGFVLLFLFVHHFFFFIFFFVACCCVGRARCLFYICEYFNASLTFTITSPFQYAITAFNTITKRPHNRICRSGLDIAQTNVTWRWLSFSIYLT